jgi:hypothetical protein
MGAIFPDYDTLNFIPLQNAMLCANCEIIIEPINGFCTVCGSAALLSILRLLGGTAQDYDPAELCDEEREVSDQRLMERLQALGTHSA